MTKGQIALLKVASKAVGFAALIAGTVAMIGAIALGWLAIQPTKDPHGGVYVKLAAFVFLLLGALFLLTGISVLRRRWDRPPFAG